MTEKYPAVLGVAERVVKALIVLNAVYGLGIVVLLIVSLLAPHVTFTALTGGAPAIGADMMRGMRIIMGVGILAVPVTHIILVQVREMLLTVRERDPFVADNAKRLNAIALGVLGLEVLRLAVGAINSSAALAGLGMSIRAGFAFTPWVAVLLLFVLARVFDQGTRMRADLDGTI